MSDVLFPTGQVAGCEITPMDLTDSEEMDSGGSATRRRWPASYFKRHVRVTTAQLTLSEWRYLRSFYSQRGTWDYFWFRDNIGRNGNIKARFTKPFPVTYNPALISVELEMDEASPVRALPEFDEVATAAGSGLLVAWYDANRETLKMLNGQAVLDAFLYDSYNQKYPALAVGGGDLLANFFAQCNWYSFGGGGDQNYRTAAAVSEFSGTHPNCTIFAFIRMPAANGDQQVFASVGTNGASGAMGLQLGTDNYFRPWLGTFGTWTNAKFLNTPNGVWRSIAVTFNSANLCSLIVNGSLVGSDTNARTFAAGPIAIGSTSAGTLVGEQGDMAQVLFFNDVLSASQCKALHNLFCYQFGLSLLP